MEIENYDEAIKHLQRGNYSNRMDLALLTGI